MACSSCDERRRRNDERRRQEAAASVAPASSGWLGQPAEPEPEEETPR